MNPPKCECHDCTQQRAREMAGTLGGLSNQMAASQCPTCHQIYLGTFHSCATGPAMFGGTITHDGITHAR